jgi:GT2 family glycosyltransferase
MNLIFSLVLYNHTIEDISPLLDSIRSLHDQHNSDTLTLCIYNGSNPLFKQQPTASQIQARIAGVRLILKHGNNIGFGAGHNLACNGSLQTPSILILANPDTSFNPHEIYPLIDWLHSRRGYSCIAPLVLLQNGEIQYTAKKNPTFLSLAVGRLGILKKLPILRSYDEWHRNLDKNYCTDLIESPYLSGSFLLIPSEYFMAVCGFDERYFLHLEDADIVRRLSLVGITAHNPLGKITHLWARGSHKSLRQTYYILKSYLRYSRKWGFSLL